MLLLLLLLLTLYVPELPDRCRHYTVPMLAKCGACHACVYNWHITQCVLVNTALLQQSCKYASSSGAHSSSAAVPVLSQSIHCEKARTHRAG